MVYAENKIPSGLDAKATPIDADVAIVGDSADSDRVKQTTFAQLRTWVEAFTSYFNVTTDTLDDITNGSTYVRSTNDYTTTEKNKLSAIEASADVTDVTNVNAAGATMNADTSLAGNGYFLDEDTMSSDDATKVASQQSIKAHVATEVANVSANTLLDVNGGTTTVVSSTTETTLYTVSVPGGTLSTANGIRTKIFIKDFGLDASDTAIFNMKYGATTVATFTLSQLTVTTADRGGTLECVLYANAATNVQFGAMSGVFGEPGNAVSSTAFGDCDEGTAAEDSTGTLNFLITVQFNASSASTKISKVFATSESIK